VTIERIEGRTTRLRRAEVIPEGEMTPRVRAMVAALNGEVEILRRDLKSARDRLAEAERAADQDQLLPVLNRRAFARALGRHISAMARYGTQASLLYFDLDGFKRINDAYGHAVGDAVLAHFARLLSANVRDSDSVGRLGGDEFAIVLAHASALQATKKAETLTRMLTTAPAEWNGARIPVSFSYGTSEIAGGDSVETALARADEAMYAQKRTACSLKP